MTTIENKSGIWPTSYCVLIEQDKTPRRVGSILLADHSKDKLDGGIQRGRIVAMSPIAFDFAQWPDRGASHFQRKPEVGDYIHFRRYSRAECEGADGETYWMIQDKELQAILDPAAFGVETEKGARNAA
jgi:co-chaperonin GroES (HSP10)